MSQAYAVVDISTNMIVNTILWDGESEYDPGEGVFLVLLTQGGIGWSYVDGEFIPPPEIPPTPEQILASQSSKLQQLTQLASAQKTALTNRIGTIQDAIELEMATPAELVELPLRQGQLVEWKRYAIYLGRVTSQPGWPPEVEWPAQPEQGMDLSVSARAAENA